MWDRVRKELATPWDWVAAGVGAAGGLGATLLLHGFDGGTSAGIGALAAVSARKAGAASLRGRTLAARAHGLIRIIEDSMTAFDNRFTNPEPSYEQLRRDIVRDLDLWKEKVITHDQFDALLNQHTEAYRRLPTRMTPNPRPTSDGNRILRGSAAEAN